MDDDEQPEHATLQEAAAKWCDPKLINEIKNRERDHTAFELSYWKGVRLVGDTSQLRRFSKQPDVGGRLDLSRLELAWCAVSRDLARLIEGRKLFVSGVAYSDSMTGQREPLGSDYASVFRFDFGKNQIEIRGGTFISIQVSEKPLHAAVAPKAPLYPLAIENIGEFSDDFIVEVIEEHARRVVANTPAKLLELDKISLIPIVRKKMQHRQQAGMMHDQLNAECEALAEWIRSKTEHFQVPTASTIKRRLGVEYRLLSQRSKGDIGRSKN